MAGQYAHARHLLPMAFCCTWRTCRAIIGNPCTSSTFHATRRGRVPERMTAEQVDEVVEMMLQLRQLRPRDSKLAAAAAESITEFMDTIRNAEPVRA